MTIEEKETLYRHLKKIEARSCIFALLIHKIEDKTQQILEDKKMYDFANSIVDPILKQQCEELLIRLKTKGLLYFVSTASEEDMTLMDKLIPLIKQFSKKYNHSTKQNI